MTFDQPTLSDAPALTSAAMTGSPGTGALGAARFAVSRACARGILAPLGRRVPEVMSFVTPNDSDPTGSASLNTRRMSHGSPTVSALEAFLGAVLKPITATCTPREDVLAGELTDQHFAAQLDAVVRDPDSYPVYGDADAFFALTYPTSGLQELLRRVFGRLSRTADGDSGVVRAETSFGGGKTHSLIAVHHLATGSRPANVEEFIDPKLVPNGCRSVALVGDALDAINGSTAPGGARALTLWGALAATLGDAPWEAMRRSDETRTPPGRETLADVIGDAPTIVMIDEIAAYLRACWESGDEDVRRMARQIPAFLKTLFEHAMSTPNLVVVITLATAADAFAEETATIQSEIDSVVGRQHGMVQPADDTDIAEIIKRRLFASVDGPAGAETAAEYRATYDKFAGQDEHLTGATTNPEGYAAAIEATYPLHPELVRVLDQRLSTIPTFQRTRGALRLLARTVRILWDNPDSAPPTLNVGDLPLDDDDLLRQLTVKLERSEFQQVADADLVGDDAHAVETDQKRGSQARHAARAATVAFVHSLERTNVGGATRGDVLLGAARPGDDPSTIIDALDDTAAIAWHLEATGERWRFTPEPNEKKILAEETEALLPGGRAGGKVLDEVDDLVASLFRAPSDQTARTTVKVDVFPSSGLRSVKDEERLHVVVVHPSELTVSGRDALPPPALLVEARDNYNDKRRRNRNGVVFVVADEPLLATMHREVAKKLAAKRLAEDDARFPGEGNRRLREKIQAAADTADLSASISVASCFSHVYWPVSDKTNSHLAHQELTPAQKGDIATSGTDRVWDLLVQHDLIFDGPVAATWLKQKGWVNQQPQISTAEVKSHLWRDHGAKIVPTDAQLTKAIAQGAEAGEWVYYDHQSQAFLADEPRGRAIPAIADVTFLVERAHAEAQGFIAPPVDVAMLLGALPEPGGDPVAVNDVRTSIEDARGGHMPTKADLREVIKSAMRTGRVKAYKEGNLDAELVPSDLDDVGFDRVVLIRPDEVSASARNDLFSGQGTVGEALGKAYARAADLIAESDDFTGISQLSVSMDLDAAGMRARAALTIPSMAQSLPMTVDLEVAAELANDLGTATVHLVVDKTTLGTAKPLVERLVAASDKCSGRIRFSVTFDEAVAPDEQAWISLRQTLTTAFADVSAKASGKVA